MRDDAGAVRLGMAVAGWAAAGSPRVTVSISEHHGSIPRVRGARHNGEIDPSVSFFVTRAAAR
ncbi:hypothetical protein Maq22A_c13510 [Methylobacterium aquaticum]|uniref:Uncharacterized protein n=1 Tax=Methylobacterium aquaticum TaxID=270351 RepID=A0A0C6F040_9HYPH|nr:hypothetical protein Maq22A_c13510 [Methylobacterium aquaticum]